MTASTRFLFDMDFNAASVNNHAAMPEPLTQPKFDQAAYDKGFAEGAAQERLKQNHAMDVLLSDILERLEMLRHDGESRKQEFEDHIISAMIDLATYFVSTTEPFELLTNPQFGFCDLFEKLEHDGGVTITLSEDASDQFRAAFTKLNRSSIPDIRSSPLLSGMDFEVNWDAGGMKFDQAKLKAKYLALLEHYKRHENQKHDT